MALTGSCGSVLDRSSRMSEGVEWSDVGALVVDLAMWSTSDFQINAELVWCLVAAIDIAFSAKPEGQQ